MTADDDLAAFAAEEIRRERAEQSLRSNGEADTDAPRTRNELILSPDAPLDSARELIRHSFTSSLYRTLHHQQATFYRWNMTCYAALPQESIRSAIYDFLDVAKVLKGDGSLSRFKPTKARVTNVLDALAAACQLPDPTRTPAWLDDSVMNPPAAEIIACQNGLLHLPTGRLLPHSPAFFALNAVDYAYDADAPPPSLWLTFLKSLWATDHAAIDTLQEIFGLLLTVDTSHQKAFLIVGPKRSGKGTIARALTALLGKENVAGPTLSSLTQNFGLAPLIDKPLAIVSDARLGGRADASIVVERLLAITGEDAITIDRKYLPAWTGRLPTRFLLLTNELPRLTDASGALASRFILLCLTESFYGREDIALTGKLMRELPGMLNWALAGYDRLRSRGHFVQPMSGDLALRQLEDLTSPINAFLRERCQIDSNRCVECQRLYDAWVAWCREQGRDHPGTVQGFGRDVRAALPTLNIVQPRDATGERHRYYQGLDLA